MVADVDQGVIGHGDDPLAGIALQLAERVKLLEEHFREARLLTQLAAGGVFERFIDVHKPARQRPHSGERIEIALDQHDLQILFIEPEDDAIDGQGRASIRVGVRHQDGLVKCSQYTNNSV